MGGLVSIVVFLNVTLNNSGFYAIITSMEMCDDDFSPESSQLLWTASQLKELKSTLLALSMMQRMEEKKGGEKRLIKEAVFLMFCFFLAGVVWGCFLVVGSLLFFWNHPFAFFWEETYQAHVM